MRQIVMTVVVMFLILSTLSMAQSLLDEKLEQKLATTPENQKVPILVLYEGMPSYAEVAREYRFLGEEEVIHEQVIRIMKENAESLHYWLRQFCTSSAMADNVENFVSIWIVNAVSLKATPVAIREIATQSNIAKILLDEPVPLLFESSREIAWGVQKINAPAVWQYYDGRGVNVAVIDTGVNEHGDLKGRVIDGKNYISSNPPRDDHGHGTHCSGTVAGDGTNGTQTGVAPKATIIAIKVLGSNGSGAWSNLYLAIEEAINYKAKVVSMSLGGFPSQDIRDRLRVACKNAIAAGIIPVIAAGNSGSQGIAAPGDVPEVITIGATDSDDYIAYFSGIGPTKWDTQSFIKPDVSAPGVDVTSCSHNSNDYLDMSGTSMATPHVAGLVALICQAKPTITTSLVKDILERTATDLGPAGKDNSYGSGRVNADKAIQAAQNLTATANDERFEMVVKEMQFVTTVDANGNVYIQQTIQNDVLPATLTVWVDVKETAGRKGVYEVSFTLQGPNGTKTGTARIDYDNIPTDPNKYDARYGFNVGNFDMVQGSYTGTVQSLKPNPKVQNVQITIWGKATWPARPGR